MPRPVLIVGGVALVTLIAGIAVAASASAGTATYEAEASANTLSGGAHTIDCRRCSGGSRVTAVGLLGGLTFTGVMAERAGATKLAVTYWGPEARTAQVSVNGGIATAVSFPATRVNRPGTLRIVATLQKGENKLAFGNPTGVAPDIDKLVITTDGTPPTAAPTVSGEPGAAVTVTPGPAYSTPPYSTPPTPSGAASQSAPPTLSKSPPASPTGRPTTKPAPTGPAPAGNAAAEAEVLALVNTERVKAGCRALTMDTRLVAAARGHSADMAARSFFSHTTPEGVDFATRITKAGYRWSGAAENIAKGQRTPADVMTSWMNSAGHKANILNCGYKNLGVGVSADATGALLWTQDFGSPL
jgi:uncharacterized protein YkwD